MSLSKITVVSGTGIPLHGFDVDTDQIIPARYMKLITFEGIGKYVFRDLRYDENGNQKAHPFNDPKYAGASIMFVNGNFGCGSSREHAPQALMDYGIKAIVGESFAEIFAGNCTALGIPAVTLDGATIQRLQDTISNNPDTPLKLDLLSEQLIFPGESLKFNFPSSYRETLVSGTWNSTNLLLEASSEIDKVYRSLPYTVHFQK